MPPLKRLLVFLEQKTATGQVVSDNAIHSLAPKVLTEEGDLEKIKPYLSSLQSALETPSINNIAITGSYGSGKSTILRTFQHHHPEYEYLNISLASFKDNKEDKEDFERKLEVSILQQMFYHVKPSKIPDSRFKRIVNLTTGKLVLHTVFFLLWLTCTIILFNFDYINKLNPRGWSSRLPFDWGSFFLILTFLAGVGLYVKSAIRLFSNSKISKVSIKGEVELNEAADKSVFNQHLEEILYFFERTRFNVVIIEDVDRFGSTDIFTKLREINILINQSNLVERKVSFVYAIKDEMFKDSRERVKFFEFIIPVIPFINPSNAGEQLTRMINSAGLQEKLPKEFTEDVVTFIDDIDMRMLINIFQEYQVYSKALRPELSQANLFSMIVYKNMYPEDFGELPKRRGKLYKFFLGRPAYAEKLQSVNKDKIDKLQAEITAIVKETQNDIKELRAVYINHIISRLEGFVSFYTTDEINSIEALEDEHFDKIYSEPKIKYGRFKKNHYGDYVYVMPVDGLSFASIDKEVSAVPYRQRARNVEDKSNGEIERLKRNIAELWREVAVIDSYGVSEIFEKTPIDEYLADFTESNLIRYLLLNGYINENYNDYISVFHGISLSQQDFTFEANVKNGAALPYEYPLPNKAVVVERLQARHFRREAIWNYMLLDELLLNHDREPDKTELFFGTLAPATEKTFYFIEGYLQTEPEHSGRFVKYLVRHKPNLWYYLFNNSNYTKERLREFVWLIFQSADYDDIRELEEPASLAAYLSELPGIVAFAASIINTRALFRFIQDNDVKAVVLDSADGSAREEFQFFYTFNAYLITPDNIRLVLQHNNIDFTEDRFIRENYTLLRESAPPKLMDYIEKNIGTYIQFVYTKLDENYYESEDSLVALLNNTKLDEKLKYEVTAGQKNRISDLTQIKEKTDKSIALEQGVVAVSWENVYEYYKTTDKSGLDDVLAAYLNLPDVYSSLTQSEIEIEAKDEEGKKLLNGFYSTLIYTDKLELQANTALLNSIPVKYKQLDYAKLKKDKVGWMIENEFVSLTVANYDGIKEEFDDLHIKLLAKNEKEFVEQFGETEFGLDNEDYIKLFESPVFSHEGKLDIIQAVDDSIIIEDPRIAELVCYLLPDDKAIPFRYEVFKAMFEAKSSLEKKINVLIVNNEYFDDSRVIEFVGGFGEDYAKVFVKQNKPVFADKPFNRLLFQMLKDRKLISSFSINTDKGEIKVVANYQ